MRRLTRGRSQDLDDLVQIAAERALRGLSAFEGRAQLSTWVFRICHSALLTHRRGYRRWLERFTMTVDRLTDCAVDDDAERALIEARRAHRVRRAIEALSPKRQAVIVLHDLQGLSTEEIATIVKVNPLTVRSRLRDGRRDLAKMLANDVEFGESALVGR
jgi:RNA polymerase sigma-70 factor (ECF subfamily)